jgi:putative transposase
MHKNTPLPIMEWINHNRTEPLKACPRKNIVFTNMNRRSSIRLADFDYRGEYAYSLTCATYQRNSYFTNPEAVSLVVDALKIASIRRQFLILLYCFMPDHLHLVASGRENALLKDFMKDFKQFSAFRYKEIYSQRLWQRSYYDHVIRQEEDLEGVFEYIINNPLRKGIHKKYPYRCFMGSFELDISEYLPG